MSNCFQTSRGFTLVELIVTVAILGILAMVAIPAYQSQIEKGRLADARAALTQDGNFMARWYADHGSYKKSSSSWPDLPVTETDFYTVTFTALANGVTTDSYGLKAEPKPQFDSDGAKYLKIDQDGNILTCSKPSGQSETCSL